MGDMTQYTGIRKKIQEAEMLLIGIGEEWRPALPAFESEDEIRPYVISEYYNSFLDSDRIVQAYRKLRELAGAKPYFVVSLNTDDLIFRGGFERDLVVTPCGSMEKMQCEEHIADAAPVRRKVLAEVRKSVEEGLGGKDDILRILKAYAVCPVCGRPLRFHVKTEEGYLESGYLDQWRSYNRWLSCTLNRKLCILELGAGFEYPQVIRWPFEKAAYFNQKAELVRVHKRLFQTPHELGSRGIAVEMDSVEFCCRQS